MTERRGQSLAVPGEIKRCMPIRTGSIPVWRTRDHKACAGGSERMMELPDGERKHSGRQRGISWTVRRGDSPRSLQRMRHHALYIKQEIAEAGKEIYRIPMTNVMVEEQSMKSPAYAIMPERRWASPVSRPERRIWISVRA